MADVRCVGPYFLKNVLGRGQTGTVRFGVHSKTNKEVAVKVVEKSKIQQNILAKVEREITIMKLIEHHNILQLYDVYESKKNLFLVLEYVDGGELFDYLVKKGRLHILEAKKLFKQLVSAVSYCHDHLVCHRDLKPENLLLDSKKNIKVADFGMASVQVENGMLETSCGSPHYACPEVVKGIPYDGKKADTWSCGVILYALVVGCLPFDDDNLRVLLEKVKKGVFAMPAFVPPECAQLIRKMITVNPEHRFTLEDVKKHPFCSKNLESLPLEPPVCPVVTMKELSRQEDLDADVLASMGCIGCFKDKENLIKKLLMPEKNTEKVIYFLLHDRKSRRPALEDDAKTVVLSKESEFVRKRVDSPNVNDARRLTHINDVNYKALERRPRAATSMSPQITEKTHMKTERPTSMLMTAPGSPWRDRFFTITRSMRSKHDDSTPSECSPPQNIEHVKKSWFLGSLFHVGHTSTEPNKIEISDRSFSQLKADLIHSILVMPKLSYSLMDNNKTFQLRYQKKKGRFLTSHHSNTVTQLEVRINESDPEHETDVGSESFVVVISFISGSHKKFRKLCHKLHSGLLHRGIHRNSTSESMDNCNNVKEQGPSEEKAKQNTTYD